jgi:hypothetical protein
VWWLTPAILTSRRLRLGGLQFQASLGRKVQETPSQKKKLGVVVCTSYVSYGGECKYENHVQKAVYFQNNLSKESWRHGSNGRVTTTKCEALSSNYSTTKKIWIHYVIILRNNKNIGQMRFLNIIFKTLNRGDRNGDNEGSRVLFIIQIALHLRLNSLKTESCSRRKQVG